MKVCLLNYKQFINYIYTYKVYSSTLQMKLPGNSSSV